MRTRPFSACSRATSIGSAKSAAGRGAAALVLCAFALAACGRDDAARAGSPEAPSLAVDVGGGVTMDFVLVPAGEFAMSADDGLPDAAPPRRAVIAKPFYLAKYETTQEQWRAVMGSDPSEFKGPKNPVENVSWSDCQEFLAKLNAKTSGARFVLPSEAQWEYACRAGSPAKWCFGDDEARLAEYAWYGSGAGGTTHPVGGKKPNAWGLYDMHGNVWEWCEDGCGGSGGDGPSPVVASAGAAAPDRVFRGGSWYFTAAGARSGCRGWGEAASLRRSTVGFRPARDAAP